MNYGNRAKGKTVKIIDIERIDTRVILQNIDGHIFCILQVHRLEIKFNGFTTSWEQNGG